MGLTIGALSFVLDPTRKSARRMFHGSLLYLPALMAGLILHRLPNEQKEQNIHQTSEMAAGVLYDSELRDEERARQKREDQKKHSRVQSRPPVAYASVAPFPFLPVPVYVSTQGHEL
jgi:protoheme IX farnesyltransferase